MLRILIQGSRRLARNNAGGVLTYVAFALPILLGVMALGVDLGRGFILNTELKNHADAAALAGAAELDGSDGARTRSEQAARTGISNTLENYQAFATDGGGARVTIDNVAFLRHLPADGTNFTSDDVATSDADARFIYVSVVPRTVAGGLIRALAGAVDLTTSAASIAGYTAVVCHIPAMFMCNPLEDANSPIPAYLNPGDPDDAAAIQRCQDLRGTVGANLDEECLKGIQVLMKTVSGTSAAYAPGNFGLLNPPGEKNAGMNEIADLVATASPTFCVGTYANLHTGQGVGPVRNAVNTRFDMYEGMFAGDRNDSNYRPALNVTKGHPASASANPCDTTIDEDVAKPLPQDPCFDSDTCASQRFGSGNWHDGVRDQTYWTTNHGAGSTPPGGYDDMMRYDVYREEINSDAIVGGTGSPGIPVADASAGTPENGAPQCSNVSNADMSDPALHPGSNGLDAIDRRILVMAVVNCIWYNNNVEALNGSSNVDIPVEGFVKVFLTEPATGTGTDQANIYGEIIGVEKLDNLGGDLKDIVQLYR